MVILKIILFILSSVLGIILLLLFLPVRAEFSFIGEKVVFKLKYAFVKIVDSNGGSIFKIKRNSNNKSKQTEEKNEKSAENKAPVSDSEPEFVKETEGLKEPANVSESDPSSRSGQEIKAEKKTLGETVGFLMDIYKSAKRPLKRLLKGFHITDIYIDFLVADEDAYKCAIKYGRLSGALYNFLAKLELVFSLKYRTIDVECGFAQEKSRWDAGCKVRFLPITAVFSGIWFLITYIFRVYLPEKNKKRKTAEKQNTQPQGGM